MSSRHETGVPRFLGQRVRWSAHTDPTGESGSKLWEQAEPLEGDELPAPRAKTTPVIVRLDTPTVQRVKALARQRRKGYQALVQGLVLERLAEEERRASS